MAKKNQPANTTPAAPAENEKPATEGAEGETQAASETNTSEASTETNVAAAEPAAPAPEAKPEIKPASAAQVKAVLEAVKKQIPENHPYGAMRFKLETWTDPKGIAIGYRAKDGDTAEVVIGSDIEENAKELVRLYKGKYVPKVA